MNVIVVVPMHRRSLAPDKVAEAMEFMLNAHVLTVTVVDHDGEVLTYEAGA
ncbi:hypothetical protein SEA_PHRAPPUCCINO_164 [Mycobacterium phage Phrappuccino]|uniref:Uncharacterized protein n=1 Tax=Mycobacterium phage Phrappuccino TaxID=2591223 RepID=A0A514DDZ9_9CAUD|nr:hypothetical protein KHQ87_gp164 [Mycobacterium phage Phrappuccino]QDH91839.1 hypothetical protein SEA_PHRAPPUCCINO_164 [Mycobacterium phage Phrappuccino]QIQ63281.1 hypothetical protein SEA_SETTECANDELA_164 [Mycobacterium phage Settecandela]